MDSLLPDINADAKKSGSALTVSQLAEHVKLAIGQSFPQKMRIVGEISNFSDRKHWFFSLKDDNAAMRCVCFASSAQRIKAPIKDGMQVVVTGRVDFYGAYGSVQIYVDNIAPVGEGALELALRQLMEELRQVGYFDPEHKLDLPIIPRRVAIVTSRAAAALQDVINTAGKRWPGCKLYLVDVRVQGAQAAGEIANAINSLSKNGQKHSIDGIILTRGGGSIEDLWAFNERIVADAIYECKLPVVAAIGHETDTTVAELVADVRCSTPTQAAMQLIPDQSTLAQQINQLESRLSLLIRRQIEISTQRLKTVSQHELFARPKRLADLAAQRLAENSKRLQGAINRRMKNEVQKILLLRRHLEAIGPNNVLQRGYSYTIAGDGSILKSAKKVKPGDNLTTVLQDGRVQSEVISQARKTAQTKPNNKRKKKNSSKNQQSLF